jgi:hypothetical protein
MALTDNLIAQYALDSDLVDSVGSFDGTNSGATFETAAGRSFASFDAADRAFLGTDFQFGAEDFTYSFWMNPEATQENYAMVFASYAEVYTGYYFVQDALNHNKYWFRGNGGSTWQPYSSTVDIPANSWTHVTIVRTGTTVSLYTNGSLAYQDTNAVASTISYGSSNPQLTLGGVSNSNAYNGWAGDLDDFRVWTRALDASEIATLYSDNVLLSDGLALHFAGDDGVDDIGGVVATTNGITFVQDEGRDAWDLGTEGVASFTRPFTIGGANDWSMSVWFKNKNSTASSPLLRGSYYWLYANSNSLGIWTSSLQDTGYDLVPADLQGWHQITAVGTTNLTTYYIDGVEVGSVATNPSDDGTSNFGTPNQLFLGAEWNGQNAWAEMISDFRMYNRALDSGEVSALYAETTVVPELTDNLIAQYALDSDAVDSINAVNGTVSNVSFQSEAGRDYAYFDGNSSYVDLGHTSNMNIGTSDFAISAWVKPDNISMSFAQIFGSIITNSASPSRQGIHLVMDSGVLRFNIGGNNTMESTTYSLPAEFAGTWNHVVATRTGTEIKLYINGSSVVTNTVAQVYNIESTTSWHKYGIGGYNWQNTWYANYVGGIDDVRVWTRALAESEVSTLYAETDISDSEAPVITMLGDNPMNLEPGDAFADPGATAVDNFDGAVSVVASGGDNISLSDDWIQVPAYPTMPTINGDGSLSFFYSSHVMARKENDVSAGDFEIVVEFDNNNTGSGDFGMSLIDGSNIVVFRQQAYNAWGANNSFFFGLWNGSSYLASGAGPAQLASGAMKIAREGTIYKFYSSSDKVSFTEMGQFDASALGWTPGDLELRVQAGSRSSVDVTGFSRSDVSEGAQEGSYTITYTAQDAAGNVATAQRSVVVEVAGSGAYDWTFNGQLTNIVKFSRGFDASGNASYAYAKKEDDNTTTLYFATNLADYATFSMYNAAASSIDGSPVCMEYGPNGAVILGTDSGKVYKIELDGSSVPQSYTLLHSMVGGDRINSIGYGEASDAWLFEAGGVVHTVPNAGGGAVARHTLPAGAKIVDFAEGDSGAVAMIIRLADFSLEPRIATSDWGSVYGPSSMVAGIETGAITDFNYGRAIDTWVASSADGNTLITSSDLLQFLK